MAIEGTKSIAEGEYQLNHLLSDISSTGADWNEAETRFRIINGIIVECLGWDPAEMRLERFEEGDYTDYELGNPRAAIWEAKRVGRAFELPANPKRRLIVDLRSIMLLSPEAEDAIQQVQKYCAQRGVEIAVATNGHQLIAFIATRNDGISPLDGKCFVLDGFAQIRSEFATLWQMLSPNGVATKQLNSFLRLGTKPKHPAKISTFVRDFPVFRKPNDLQRDLQIISDLLLTQIESWPEYQRDFYARCYCKNWSISNFSLLSKKILDARFSMMFSATGSSPDVVPIKKKTIRGLLNDEVLAEAMLRRPIVLLGEVGVGKTAFLKNLMLVEAEPEFARAICIYIDLSSKGALAQQLSTFVLSEIEHNLRERYGVDVREAMLVETIYAAELERFEHGVWGRLRDTNPTLFMQRKVEYLAELFGNVGQHIGRVITYLKATMGREFIIVLDNADQRASNVQLEAFAIATEFSKSYDALVFMAMRPATYLQIRQDAGASDGSQRVFSISPPFMEEMIRQRLGLAVDIAEGRLPIQRLKGVTIDLTNFAHVARAVTSGLEARKPVKSFFANFFDGNARAAVGTTTEIIGSTHINQRRLLEISKMRGGALVLEYDIVSTVIFGKFFHFDRRTSMIVNVFDLAGSDPSGHFLLPMILGYLNTQGSSENPDGFIREDLILAEMQDWGFPTGIVQEVLDLAANEQNSVIYCRRHGEAKAYRIKSRGAWYLSGLLAEFVYLDAMSLDTPIYNPAHRARVQNSAEQTGWPARHERAEAFRSYLTEVWRAAALRPTYFDWQTHVNAGNNSFNAIKGLIERGSNQGRI